MSTKFQNLVNFLTKLPGIGPRQAARLTMALLHWPKEELNRLAQTLTELNQSLVFCSQCFNFSEEELCEVCANPRREKHKICVVERVTDLHSIEKTGIFRGHYHVLGGAINPVDGFLPQRLKIPALIERIKKLKERAQNGSASEIEIILATNPNTYGDTTAMYLEELLKPLGVKKSRLAKGLASGSYLEYVDAITLQNAFKNRK